MKMNLPNERRQEILSRTKTLVSLRGKTEKDFHIAKEDPELKKKEQKSPATKSAHDVSGHDSNGKAAK